MDTVALPFARTKERSGFEVKHLIADANSHPK